ncbi:MAG TPA: AraC family transcriptional regulator [Anaerovoracaceae bacterium]|nr:AraC family transcriptional regulator [Anaerovoracaceae bacterium]
MLEKTIHFKDGLPVDAFISTVENIPLHIHQTLEFVMVLEGALELREAYQSYILNDGDIHIFNPPDLHGLTGLSRTNCVLTLYIDLDYLTKFCAGINHMSFLCDCDNQKGSSVELLRHMLADIYVHFSQGTYANTDRLDHDLGGLVTLLLDSFLLFRWLPDGSDHFLYGCPPEFHINAVQAERIHSVQDYIYNHFTENITLGDLAKHEYLSTYYLSRYIKQSTGLSFQQWLSSVRSEFAEKLLVSTDKTISQIALEAGFASTKYLISNFKKWYGCTPSKYREITASMHSHLPHRYYSCDRIKAEKLLNSYRYENSHSGKDVQKGFSISSSLEKETLPQKSGNAKVRHYINLLLLSGEIYSVLSGADGNHPGHSMTTEALLKELKKIPPETLDSYEAFLAEIMRFLKILPQKEA